MFNIDSKNIKEKKGAEVMKKSIKSPQRNRKMRVAGRLAAQSIRNDCPYVREGIVLMNSMIYATINIVNSNKPFLLLSITMVFPNQFGTSVNQLLVMVSLVLKD